MSFLPGLKISCCEKNYKEFVESLCRSPVCDWKIEKVSNSHVFFSNVGNKFKGVVLYASIVNNTSAMEIIFYEKEHNQNYCEKDLKSIMNDLLDNVLRQYIDKFSLKIDKVTYEM